MALTPEQQELLDMIRQDETAKVTVGGFQNACQFEGLPIPSDEDVRAALGG